MKAGWFVRGDIDGFFGLFACLASAVLEIA